MPTISRPEIQSSTDLRKLFLAKCLFVDIAGRKRLLYLLTCSLITTLKGLNTNITLKIRNYDLLLYTTKLRSAWKLHFASSRRKKTWRTYSGLVKVNETLQPCFNVTTSNDFWQVGCCGISNDDEGYKDWNANEYFNCTEPPARLVGERCGVPWSCCVLKEVCVNHDTLNFTRHNLPVNDNIHVSLQRVFYWLCRKY